MIYSNNEWSPLKRILIGSATNAHWPVKCPIFRKQEQTTLWKNTPVPSGSVSKEIINEANEDLENFSNILKSLDIIVERPTNLNFSEFDGMYNYCPRDRILIVGDKIIDAPMLYSTRKKEIDAVSHLFSNDIISCNDPEVIFDAANVCRIGKDILYLVSDSGNIKGAEWLSKILQDHNIHVLDNIYKGFHIDSTISVVREGLVVINADRINKKNLPDILKDWDIIYINGEDIVPQSFVNYPYASKYIALNFLTVNPNLVICDPNQTVLRKQLEGKKVETIGVNLRHSRTLGGGHHCVTLDLERD